MYYGIQSGKNLSKIEYVGHFVYNISMLKVKKNIIHLLLRAIAMFYSKFYLVLILFRLCLVYSCSLYSVKQSEFDDGCLKRQQRMYTLIKCQKAVKLINVIMNTFKPSLQFACKKKF